MVSSSGSSQILNSGSEGDPQAVMAQRKQKRKLSNRESARRSRMRKQKHLDDLMAQVGHLRKENNQILSDLNITTQRCLGVEAENSVLRTQMMELSTRLQSLNEILHCIISIGGSDFCAGISAYDEVSFLQPWTPLLVNQPHMTSSDMFQYC
ncbi:Ocs element-binding factor 1 [Apostasia shenzhenica]|uniref:Ocs element-binding factor 1 n=1 Tax=Apostasia shenzhenica TaxID=1088818 RepID=A0A2I0A1B3_9ASPA|nr:Ocs element-binding factor 1 [Apostasia shenzhenica]